MPSRSSIWEWAQTALLVANLAWTTVCLGGYRAETMIITSTLTVLLLGAHALAVAFPGAAANRPGESASGRGCHHAGWWLLPFLAYALANVIWVTPVRWLGWMDWFGWLQLIAVFWVVLNGVRSRGAQRVLIGALLLLAVVGVVLGCYQRFVQPSWLMLRRVQADQYLDRASGFFGIPNSLAALLLLLIPFAGALTFRRGARATTRVLFGWLTLVLLFGLFLTISRGAWIGFAVALTVWPLAAVRGGWWRRLRIALAVVGALAGLAIATYAASPKVRERITHLIEESGERSRPILWRAAWSMFRSEPWLGTGAGSFNPLFEKFRPAGFLHNPQWAHNEYLNTLSDYGVVGFALLFGPAFVIVTVAARRGGQADHRLASTLGESAESGSGDGAVARRRRSSRRRVDDPLDDPLVRQGLGIGLLAFAIQLFVDFHFKLAALAMAFAIVAGLLVSRRWPARTTTRFSPFPRIAVAIGCAALAAVVWVQITPRYRAESLREQVREAIDLSSGEPASSALYQRRIAEARIALAEATALDPSNAQAWSDLSYALAQASRIEDGRVDTLGKEAELAADKAIALMPSIAEFYVRRGVARDMQGRWHDASRDFTRAMSLAPNTVLPWYHYAYHLTLRASERPYAVRMLEYCLRLDPLNRDALALRQRLATGQIRP